MPYAKVNSATSSLDLLARTVAVPRDHKPQRLPTFPALERTAILSFTNTQTFATGAGTPGYACVVRDPAIPLWISKVPHYTSWAVATEFKPSNSNAATTNVYNVDVLGTTTLAFYDATGPTDGLTNCSCFPLYLSGGSTYMPLFGARWAFQAEFGADPGNTAYRYQVEYVYPNQDLKDVIVGSAAATISAGVFRASLNVAAPAGAVAFRVQALTVITTNNVTHSGCLCGITSEVAASMTPITAPAIVNGALVAVLVPASGPVEATSVSTPWQSVRATAAAVLFSNVAAVLNKEGTINAARLATTSVNMFDTKSWADAIGKVHPDDRYFGPLEKGIYTFTLPDGASDTFREVLMFENLAVVGTQPVVAFDLDLIKYAHLISFDDLDAATGATTLAVTLDRHIEFRTTSVLFPTNYSHVALETYHAAQMALVNKGVFYENPLHLSAIASMVSAAVKRLAPIVAPYALTAAKMAGNAAIKYATKKFGDMTQSAPGAPPSRAPKPKPKAKKIVRVKRK